MADSDQWHLDKRVPIALLVAILVQTSGAVWWASGMHERMGQAERRLEGFSSRNGETEKQVTTNGQTIAVVATELRSLSGHLARVQDEIQETNKLLRQMILGGER